MLIDAHHHLVVDKSVCGYAERYAEKVEEVADEFGIDHICVMGLGEGFAIFGDNDAVLALSAESAKVIPVAHVELDTATNETIKVFVDQGFAGFKCIAPRRPYNSDEYIGIYEAMAATGKFVYFHTGLIGGGEGDRDSANMRPVHLDRICNLFPEMPVIMAHLGGMAWLNEGLALLGYHENLYCDLTGGPARLAAEWFVSFAVRTPLKWERVVFGTDSMIGDFGIPYQAYREKMDFFKLDDDARGKIMGERMAELIGLPRN